MTVRKALAELTQEGLLNRHQGKGTFVGVPRIRKDLRDVNSFHDTCRVMGSAPDDASAARAMGRIPEETDARELNCEPGEQVLEIVRLRLADDIPVMLETNRFPADLRLAVGGRFNGFAVCAVGGEGRGGQTGGSRHFPVPCHARTGQGAGGGARARRCSACRRRFSIRTAIRCTPRIR